MKIPLTKGAFAVVDDSMKHLAEHRWYLNNGYARGYFYENLKTKSFYMHHCVVGRPINGCDVDHIDGNKLNNQRSNLRIVTRQENMWNISSRRNGLTTSKYIGVYRNKKGKAWESIVRINGKATRLGSFQSEDQAHAYHLWATNNPDKIIFHHRIKASKYTGVSWHKKRGMWCAKKMVNWKWYWIGYFKDQDEAGLAYKNFNLDSALRKRGKGKGK